MSTKRQDQPASSSNNRRRQREDSSSSSKQQQPHHVMTQPVFLQKIFPFVAKRMSTPLRFNSVSSSWSETIQHYSGAQLSWKAFICATTPEDAITRAQKLKRALSNSLATHRGENYRVLGAFRYPTWMQLALLDTLLLLPPATQDVNANLLCMACEYDRLQVEVIEKVFDVLEEIGGVDLVRSQVHTRTPRSGLSPAHFVCQRSIPVMEKYFYKIRAILGERSVRNTLLLGPITPLMHSIAKSPTLAPVRFLLKLAGDIDEDTFKEQLSKWDESGRSVLQIACLKTNASAVEFLKYLIDSIKSTIDDRNLVFLRYLLQRVSNYQASPYSLLETVIVNSNCPADLLRLLVHTIINDFSHETPRMREVFFFRVYSTPQTTPLMLACRNSSSECVNILVGAFEQLFRETRDISFLEKQFTAEDQAGHTALIHSLMADSSAGQSRADPLVLDQLKILLEMMGKVRSSNNNDDFFEKQLQVDSSGGHNVLLLAAARGPEVFNCVLGFFESRLSSRSLLHFLKAPNTNGRGLTPLMAAMSNNDETVKLIVQALVRFERDTEAAAQMESIRRNHPGWNAIQVGDFLASQPPPTKSLETQLEKKCETFKWTPFSYAALNRKNGQEAFETILRAYFQCFDGADLVQREARFNAAVKALFDEKTESNSPTAPFQVACAKSSSFEFISFLLNIIEGFDDPEYTKKQLRKTNTNPRKGFSAFKLLLETSALSHQNRIKALEMVGFRLIQFDMFEDQLQSCTIKQKTTLRTLGVDERLPLKLEIRNLKAELTKTSSKLERQQQIHAVTVDLLEYQSSQMKRIEDKLEEERLELEYDDEEEEEEGEEEQQNEDEPVKEDAAEDHDNKADEEEEEQDEDERINEEIENLQQEIKKLETLRKRENTMANNKFEKERTSHEKTKEQVQKLKAELKSIKEKLTGFVETL